MRKAAILMIAALVMVFAASQVFSGENCTAAKKTSAKACTGEKMTAEKSACTGDKAGATKMSMATAHMTPEECAKACGMTAEECKQFCAEHDGCGFTMINVKGMTCGGCEQAVTSALSQVEGVHKVIKVDHKEGMALVCTMKDKVQSDNLTKAISSKGFTAEVIPAVATSETKVEAHKSSMKAGCDPKACAASAKKGCCPSAKGKTAEKTSESH